MFLDLRSQWETQPANNLDAGVTRPRWIPDAGIIPNLLLSTLAATVPFVQTDWSQVSRSRFVTTDVVPNLLTAASEEPRTPFNQSDWPTVYRPRWISAEPTPPNLLAAASEEPITPFVQSDWPQVTRPRWIAAEPVAQALTLSTLFPTATPFAQTDWPQARRQPWVANLLLYRPPAPVVNPFALSDWPRVYRLPWIAKPDDEAQNAFFWQKLAPFNFDDGWPPPFGWRSAHQAEVVLNNLLLGILQPSGAVPAGKHHKRYGVRDGDKLLVFDTKTAADAMRATINARGTGEAPKLKRIKVVPQPTVTIDLPQMSGLAQEQRKAAQFNYLLDTRAYYRPLISMYFDLKREDQLREEEEIAMILLHNL